jgi:PAS domain S-box-containing protein
MPLKELGFLFDDNPNPMWIFDLSALRIVRVNKAAIMLYGYNEEEFLQLSANDLRPKSEHQKFNAYINQVRADAQNPQLNDLRLWQHQRKNGELIYVEITSHDIVYNNSDCRIVVAMDVTEKIHYQDELVWTKNSLEALINNTEDQIWSVDKETRYVYMNKAYQHEIDRLTGIMPKEGDYSYLHTGFGATVINKWKQLYQRALSGERYSIINETIDPENKEILSFEVSFNPIYKTPDEITGIGCFARNITERLKTEIAIIDQNERLRNIASLTSHELRRPVASMLGLINIMDRSNFFNPDNKEIIEHLLTVGNEIDEVIRLIVDKTFTDDLPSKYQVP